MTIHYAWTYVHLLFFTSFLASLLSQLWILRGHFLCCLSLMRLQGTPYCKSGTKTVLSLAIRKMFSWYEFPEMCRSALFMYSWKTVYKREITGVAGSTYFFSSSLDITKRVKFLSSMKPIINAMAPPTAEAMMMVSVLSTTLTAIPKDHHHKSKSLCVFLLNPVGAKVPQKYS